ncbi:NAD(P)-dependent oxidoreductase [Uliginosibacterium sp. H1]|uniref:NAD(P)-dependent oxidoreductase n=1 Tax=Uliginosibacterium sp. H1 TaxID=3114757 RepID=UPI002E188E2D|nr:prephenate dehydrogenase/arogenate dehydrogenase family protein [Uliginosibacterium sp. H1]
MSTPDASSIRRIALLHPGEMGSAVGGVLQRRGLEVRWVGNGRSAASRQRAQAAGLTEVADLRSALSDADVVLSIVPPHAALEVAQSVAALHFTGLYIDANAVAPDTARQIETIVREGGARFVDGGIIGLAPPSTGSGTRLYLSGDADVLPALVAALHGDELGVHALPGGGGAASALKLAYAAWTKGSIALLAAIQAFAEAEGVSAALKDEWDLSQPGLSSRAQSVTGSARKAWRWVGEMEEIAAAFQAQALPGGFHEAAADIFWREHGFKDAAVPPSLSQLIAALQIKRADDRSV